MPRSSTDWYLVLIVAAIVVLNMGAAFYCQVFANVDPTWFEGIGLTGFGALLGLLVPKSITVPQQPPTQGDSNAV